jgi:hypothetical protein
MTIFKFLLFVFSITQINGLQDLVFQKSIQSLTFNNNHMTTHRRLPPVRQMECVGQYCDQKYIPATMQCYNRGTNDHNSVVWKCEAPMQPGLKLGSTKVTCEGYNSQSDPYILPGSSISNPITTTIPTNIPTNS